MICSFTAFGKPDAVFVCLTLSHFVKMGKIPVSGVSRNYFKEADYEKIVYI